MKNKECDINDFIIIIDDKYIYVGDSYFSDKNLFYNGKITIFSKDSYLNVKELHGTENEERLGLTLVSDKKYFYVGSQFNGNNGFVDNGKVTIYDKSDFSIVKELYGVKNYGWFGSSIAVDDKYIYIGSKGEYKNFYGKVTIFKKSDYSIVKELHGENINQWFGSSLAVDENYIYIGSEGYKLFKGKISIYKKSDFSIVKELFGTETYKLFEIKDVDNKYIYIRSKKDKKEKVILFNKSDFSFFKEI